MLLRESLRRPRSEGLHCGETVERGDDGRAARVIFQCNLPPDGDGSDNAHEQQLLQFNCREPSCGALEGGERAAALDDEDYAVVDPNFFDGGYTMAGATGFKARERYSLILRHAALKQTSLRVLFIHNHRFFPTPFFCAIRYGRDLGC